MRVLREGRLTTVLSRTGRALSSGTRGRLVEPRAAPPRAPPAIPAGSYTIEAIEVAKADMPSRAAFFERTKQSALEHLEAQLAACAPGSAESARIKLELDELRSRDEPLGVLLTRPDVGEPQPGDILKVRVIEMDRGSRFVTCSRVYPRKVNLRVVQDPDVELLVSAPGMGGVQTTLAFAKDHKVGEGGT